MDGSATYCDWIAVDWGTTCLRVWAMSADGREIARAKSNKGMSTLAPDEFEGALLELIDPWLGAVTTDVIACGMVGSRQGWIEAAYSPVPCHPLTENLAQPTTSDSRISVKIISGIKQDTPADVMRGEETQIAGFIAKNKDWDGVLCLPGTHTKWVHISAGEIVSFQTFMTGEIFATLSQHSVLRHSVDSDGWDDTAFAEAIRDAMAKPERLAARLFSLRSQGLLQGLSNAAAKAQLSGQLIGSELAAARPYWLGQQVAVIGSDALSDIYVTALSAQGVQATNTDGTALTLAGLTAAFAKIREPA